MTNDYVIDGDTVIIYVNGDGKKNREVLIDLEDFEKVNSALYRWCAHKLNRNCYARTRINGRMILMHRLILGLTKDDKIAVDHIDGNTLNNKKSNLRKVTWAENSQNSHVFHCISGVRNVYWSNVHKKWRAEIKLNRKSIVGRYVDTIEEAEKEAIELRKKYFPFSQDALNDREKAC